MIVAERQVVCIQDAGFMKYRLLGSAQLDAASQDLQALQLGSMAAWWSLAKIPHEMRIW